MKTYIVVPYDIYSYAFDLKSGGRRHSVDEFEDVEELKKIMLNEVVNEIKLDQYD